MRVNDRQHGLQSLVLGIVLTIPPAYAAVTLEVDNPRPFGHVIGDVVNQRVIADAPAGYVFAADTLPKPGRVDLWLERRATRHATHGGHHEIMLEYQVMNAPAAVQTIALPPLVLTFRDGQRTLEESAGEWPITVAPITPVYVLSRAGLEAMRPDHTPPPIDTRAMTTRLAVYAGLLALVAAWAALRRFGLPWLPGSPGAFARARRDILRLARQPKTEQTYRVALRRLHRAFDETAGRSVFPEQLGRFFAEHPHYAPLREATEQFYRESQRAFFADGGAAESANRPCPHVETGGEGHLALQGLLLLCRRLRDAEQG